MGDFTESIQVEFDPSVLTYAQLLKVFWKCHSPFSRRSVQYCSALFPHSAEQEKLCRETMAQQEAVAHRKVYTKVVRLPVTEFVVAEAYHQKYYLRGRRSDLTKALDKALGSSDSYFIDSTISARLNAMCSGRVTFEQVRDEFEELDGDKYGGWRGWKAVAAVVEQNGGEKKRKKFLFF